jgi:dihydroorotate dehydrogenase electron transfer subunit
MAGEPFSSDPYVVGKSEPAAALAHTLFREAGEVVSVLDTDGTSAVDNVERILDGLIAQKRADAFFTCGSNRLFQLMKRVGKAHNILGQVAMEQVMACGLGPCYVCVRTFEVGGKKELRRVCIEGPVFDMQEAVGW